MKKVIRFFKSGNKGFTLIELLVVVAILGILAAVALPNIITMIDEGKKVAVIADLATVQTAADAYAVANGTQLAATNDINMGSLDDYLRSIPKGTFGIYENGTVYRIN